MFENQYVKLRIEKAQALRDMGKDPYGHDCARDTTAKAFLDSCANVASMEGQVDSSRKMTLAGRIKFLRQMGKAAFAKIEDESGVVQIYFSRDELGEEWFAAVNKLIEVGDIVEACGYPFVTKTGELTLRSTSLKLLTKAITPLPEKFHGLTDTETRYRQRYLDLIMNREVKEVFFLRSRIVSLVRRFFEEKGFLEVETPMLHPLAGGANARPFITHHNTLGEDRFLRIAPELYLKRLIVGGFEAVFELNRNFRNEGMDHTHNPEFTMVEFYWAYHGYEELMALTEELFLRLLGELGLGSSLEFDSQTIDFSAPFAKVPYREAIVNIGGVPSDVLESAQKIRDYLKSHCIECDPKHGHGNLLAELFDNFVEKKLINPTFITQFPIEISPLAKRNASNPDIADRFELFIAGREIANGFNELNDPIDQHGRFAAQVAAKAAGDVEACDMDEDFIDALSYGLPPTAGEGIGIDRLVMLLTGQHSIKDVMLFPAMRMRFDEQTPKKEEK